MKKMILTSMMVLLCSQAYAMSTEQFIDTLTGALNQRLTRVNAQRAQEGKKLYCPQLSEKQVDYLARLFLEGYSKSENKAIFTPLGRVGVRDFIGTAADGLFCYPLACPSQGRSTLGVAICNAKSYTMDSNLLEGALEDIAGRKVENYESLANIVQGK